MVTCYRITVSQLKQSGNMLHMVMISQNPKAKTKEGKRGEELIMNKQVYSWTQNVNGLA